MAAEGFEGGGIAAERRIVGKDVIRVRRQDHAADFEALQRRNPEIIADGVHVNDKALKLLFISKPENKIILVSDCLPCTHSNIKQFMFADKPITFDGEKATSSDGTLAGSSKLLPDIIKILAKKNLMKPQYIAVQPNKSEPQPQHGLAFL